MSDKGNRSNPNQTRVEGHRDPQDGAHINASGEPRIGKQGGAVHQETRDHSKHNDQGQSGHKPQKHSPAEEKH
ncbi:hypothetical protein [Microvirga roseola]|uniref:hypothetical protein n=1 Tax=Microvirga roseola TaxID=2883126 RepID=UPI001E538609|nr:hypothetical protein [Microvirga roseola]